jgi:hypothetical protein
LAIEKNAWKACAVSGRAPFAYDGCWREGFILNATPGIREALVQHRAGAVGGPPMSS